MAIRLTNRTTFAELAEMIRASLGLGERLADRLISAILATCPFWMLGGIFFSLGFMAPPGERQFAVFVVTFLMWGPCTLATVVGFHNVFKGDR